MKKKQEEVLTKKVYKTDMKLLKRIGIGLILIIIAVAVALPVKYYVSKLYLDSWKWHKFTDFQYEVKLPRAYKEMESESVDVTELVNSLLKTEMDVEVIEEYNAKRPTVSYYGGNVVNGVSLMIQSFKTEKTTRTLDDIADSQHIMVTVYYDNQYDIDSPRKEYVTALGVDAIRTEADMTDRKTKEVQTIVNYLIPTDDLEVTLTFLGKKENIEKADEQIRTIVNSLQKSL